MNRSGMVAGPAMILVVFMALAGRSGPDWPHMGFDAVLVLLEALPIAAAWLLAAIGFGWPLRSWLARNSAHGPALQAALGIAAMLTLDSALGRLGLLQVGGSLGAWAVIVAGLALLLVQITRRGWQREVRFTPPNWMMWAGAPAIAVLLLASTSAPGWLWDTEYAGYDALSYHLQLPKEWMAIGAITPLTHNVYSFFPGAMETAYYHVMVLRGDAIRAAYACQLLHAMIGVVAAWVAGCVAARVMGECAKPQAAVGRWMAFVLILGTPWVTVTGSLAYNEMPVLLMLAAGMLVLADHDLRSRDPEGAKTAGTGATRSRTVAAPLSRSAMIGFFAGAGCAAKLTAIGFVAAPLGALLLMTTPPRAWLRAIPVAAIAATLAASPGLIHNTLVAGNPVFPFATNVFGTAHWDAEQAAIWRDGHRSDLPLGGRIIEAWHQLMRYGIGAAPPHEARWHAQWSILPWLVIAGIVVLIARPPRRAWGVRLLLVIGIQIVFWIALTHIKSRFMLPMVVPGATAIAMAFVVLWNRDRKGACSPFDGTARSLTVAVLLLLWSAIPVYVFWHQASGGPAARIGMAEKMTGDGLSRAERAAIGRHYMPAVYVNHLLPRGSRVLMIGEAAPFYFHRNFTYTTTWDRGPLSRLMRDHPDDPRAWFDALREAGYTHVLVHPIMLERWEEAGWNDPLITASRIVEAAEAHATLDVRWPPGQMLFTLE